MKSVALNSGSHAIIIRIPKSWNSPHRVVAQGNNRFYARHSAGVYEPTVEELRTLFTQSISAIERAERFRDQRILEVCSGDSARPLVAEGRFFLHIVPTAAFSGFVNLEMEAVHLANATFAPVGSNGWTPRYNYHGFINERGGDENCGYTQVFRNGCLEAAKAPIVRIRDGARMIFAPPTERQIFQKLAPYINGLRDIAFRIPAECCHPFRRNAATRSGPTLPPIPA